MSSREHLCAPTGSEAGVREVLRSKPGGATTLFCTLFRVRYAFLAPGLGLINVCCLQILTLHYILFLFQVWLEFEKPVYKQVPGE